MVDLSHAATRCRVTPLEAADTALAADRGHDDPAIWITRLTDEAIVWRARANWKRKGREAARSGACLRGEGQHRYRRAADHSGLPRLRLYRDDHSPRCAAPVGRRCAADRQDQSRSVRHRPRWNPQSVWRAAQCLQCRLHSRRLVVRFGRAVAAGIVRFALGTDTAGSGRVPAAFGNIVGLKPTRGSVSTRGLVPACRSLDTVSIFAPSVDEALAVQRVIAGYDTDDPYSRVAPFAYLRRGVATPSARIATAETVDISLFLEIARLLYDGPWVAERIGCIARRGGAASRHPAPGNARDPRRRTEPPHRRCIRCVPSPRRGAPRGGDPVPRVRRTAAADGPVLPDIGRGGGESDRREQPPRHLHQLRQPVRPRRHRGAGGFRQQRTCRSA